MSIPGVRLLAFKNSKWLIFFPLIYSNYLGDIFPVKLSALEARFLKSNNSFDRFMFAFIRSYLLMFFPNYAAKFLIDFVDVILSFLS